MNETAPATRHVRGYLLRGTARYALSDLPSAARSEIDLAMPGLARSIDDIRRDGWYPLGRLVELINTIDQLHPDPDRGLVAIKSCGKYIAEEGATTYLKLVMKVITPKLFVRQFPALWKRYHDFGELTVDTRRIDDNRATLRMPAYPGIRGLCTGWIEYAFASLDHPIAVESNWPWRGAVPERLELTLTWN